MTTDHYRNVVLGAGAMGLATAYHLARRGEPVALIEQFSLGHDRGSSHGAARIIRHSYADPSYARLMPAAFDAWRCLEVDACQTLYLRSGGVSFGPRDAPYVDQVTSNLDNLGVAHRRMTGLDWSRCHPEFRLPDSFAVVFEPDAGVLMAAKALAAEVELARSLGPDTRIIEHTPIDRIDLDGPRPTLIAAHRRIEADRLIVTAGAWTSRLIPTLADRLRPTRQVVFYLKPAHPEPFSLGRFPVFIFKGPGELDAFYGMPSVLGLGVKVARHGGLAVDPDETEREVTELDRRPVLSFLQSFLPALADSPIEKTEVCLYTMADDEQFQLGNPAGRGDVIVASPCSGHGFKFSCLIGSILADLALEGRTDHDVTNWRFK